MTTSVRWSKLVGQRVVARDSGQLLGSLRRVLLDAETCMLRAAQLDGGGGGTSIIDWSAIADVAGDAVIATDAAAAREPRSDAERGLLAGRHELLGKLVMTEMGDSLGQLEDFEIDLRNGRVMRLHVPGDVLELESILVIGADLLILPSADDDTAEGSEEHAPEGAPPAAATA